MSSNQYSTIFMMKAVDKQ